MKAVQLVRVGRPLELREVPCPEPGPDEVLVRVQAAGICHSDAHYRAGISPTGKPPLTPGHEVSGVVERIGDGVLERRIGERVCLHYLVTCGRCRYCRTGQEQFCPRGQMIGKHRDGGYAEYIAVPEINAVLLPDEISFEHGAVLMCSSATSFHALRKARLSPGETVAVFGAGGLGLSAVQLARVLGALEVYAVDINPQKLAKAEALGAVPVNASDDPVPQIMELTAGRGVDVAVELIGLPETMEQSLRCLAVLGRTALAGITDRPFSIQSYTDSVGKETEIIGVSDHLLSELPLLLDYARRGVLDLSRIVASSVELKAEPINGVLDQLESYRGEARTVIKPEL
jgi:2-desacetyl-2-hydroxyethyl bacteriochlorophyllide A dehydrogenase